MAVESLGVARCAIGGTLVISVLHFKQSLRCAGLAVLQVLGGVGHLRHLRNHNTTIEPVMLSQ